jgi:hypothetical protein
MLQRFVVKGDQESSTDVHFVETMLCLPYALIRSVALTA